MHGGEAWQRQYSGPLFALIKIFRGHAVVEKRFVHRNERIRRKLVKFFENRPKASSASASRRRLTGRYIAIAGPRAHAFAHIFRTAGLPVH
jgi:hypothetical protein